LVIRSENYRLFLVSIIISMKFNEDYNFNDLYSTNDTFSISKFLLHQSLQMANNRFAPTNFSAIRKASREKVPKGYRRKIYTYMHELVQLERVFLETIDYRLTVGEGEAEEYFNFVNKRSQVLQCHQFKLYVPNFSIVEDYFRKPSAGRLAGTSAAKAMPVLIGGKVFKDNRDLCSYYNCEEIYEEDVVMNA